MILISVRVTIRIYVHLLNAPKRSGALLARWTRDQINARESFVAVVESLGHYVAARGKIVAVKRD